MLNRYPVATLALIIACAPASANADDVHPMMTSEYWVHLGAFFAARDLDISAQGSVLGPLTPMVDFETSVDADDKPDLFTIEAGWQFTQTWSLGLQHFGAARSGSKVIDERIEWDDLVFDVGASVYGRSDVEITRAFFSRKFRGDGPHSLQLGAGFHYLKLAVEYGGEARIDDQTTSFDSSRKSTSTPVPNVGAWYRYSPSERWMLSTRIDWFSASIGDIDGGIWNVAAGAHYSFGKHFGVGLTYQFFEVDITLNETAWRGDVRARFAGPNLLFSGYW